MPRGKPKKPPPQNPRRNADLGRTAGQAVAPETVAASASCPSFALLPLDILRLVFGHISDVARIPVLGLVCRRWRALALEMGSTSAAGVPDECIIAYDHSDHAPSGIRSVKIMAASDLFDDTDDGSGSTCLCCFAVGCTSLHSLSLCSSHLSCPCVPRILRNNIATLTSLTLSLAHVANSVLPMLASFHLPHLRHLSLELSGQWAHDAVPFVVRHAAQLASFSYIPTPGSDDPIEESQIYALAFPSLTRLHASFSASFCSTAAIAVLCELAPGPVHLSLAIQGLHSLGSANLTFARLAPHVREVMYHPSVGQKEVRFARDLARCEHLTCLALKNTTYSDSPTSIDEFIVPHIRRLRILRLIGRGFRFCKWMHHLAQCASLTELHMDASALLAYPVPRITLTTIRHISITFRALNTNFPLMPDEPQLEPLIRTLGALLVSTPRLRVLHLDLPRAASRQQVTIMREFLEKAERGGVEFVRLLCKQGDSVRPLRAMVWRFRWMKVDVEGKVEAIEEEEEEEEVELDSEEVSGSESD